MPEVWEYDYEALDPSVLTAQHSAHHLDRLRTWLSARRFPRLRINHPYPSPRGAVIASSYLCTLPLHTSGGLRG